MLRLKGILMIVIGAMLWGMTGSITEWVLANTELSVPFILTIRMIIAGSSILAFLSIKKEDIFTVCENTLLAEPADYFQHSRDGRVTVYFYDGNRSEQCGSSDIAAILRSDFCCSLCFF